MGSSALPAFCTHARLPRLSHFHHWQVPEALRARFAAVIGLPPAANLSMGGGFQLVEYPRAGHYTCHLDSDPASPEHTPALARTYTLLVQLRTLPGLDGATWFPSLDEHGAHRPHTWYAGRERTAAFAGHSSQADAVDTATDLFCQRADGRVGPAPCESGGLRVPSVQGQALLWLNHAVAADGSVDSKRVSLRTVHAGCAVHGTVTKQVATQWVTAEAVEHWCSVPAAAAVEPACDADTTGAQQPAERTSRRRSEFQ